MLEGEEDQVKVVVTVVDQLEGALTVEVIGVRYLVADRTVVAAEEHLAEGQLVEEQLAEEQLAEEQ